MIGGGLNTVLKAVGSLLKYVPKSRNGALSNKIRQAEKFGKGLNYNQADRYWSWASLSSEQKALQLLNDEIKGQIVHEAYHAHKSKLLESITTENDFNEVLLADMQLVLPNDMLRKVDLMSMAHGLEVRVPFLDHHLVDFVFQLPVSSKINTQMRKRILQDAFKDMLPQELYNRPKKGFEVPLLKWFRTSLKSLINDDLLSDKFIEEQNIFDRKEIRKLKNRLFSINPGDAHAKVWALIVFQWWWKKYFG